MPVTEVDSSWLLRCAISPFYDADTNMLYGWGRSNWHRREALPGPIGLGPWSARQGQGQARVAGSSIPVGEPPAPLPTFLAPPEHLGQGWPDVSELAGPPSASSGSR